MDRYGGVGLAAVRKWRRTPLVTVAWLMGSAVRRAKKQSGPDGCADGPADDDSVVRMLEAQLKGQQVKRDVGLSASSRKP